VVLLRRRGVDIASFTVASGTAPLALRLWRTYLVHAAWTESSLVLQLEQLGQPQNVVSEAAQ
jgi:hypothetical protein